MKMSRLFSDSAARFRESDAPDSADEQGEEDRRIVQLPHATLQHRRSRRLRRGTRRRTHSGKRLLPTGNPLSGSVKVRRVRVGHRMDTIKSFHVGLQKCASVMELLTK